MEHTLLSATVVDVFPPSRGRCHLCLPVVFSTAFANAVAPQAYLTKEKKTPVGHCTSGPQSYLIVCVCVVSFLLWSFFFFYGAEGNWWKRAHRPGETELRSCL